MAAGGEKVASTYVLLGKIDELMKRPNVSAEEVEDMKKLVRENLSKLSEDHNKEIQQYKYDIHKKEELIETLKQREKELEQGQEATRNMRKSADMHGDTIIQLIAEREDQRAGWVKEKEELMRIKNEEYTKLTAQQDRFFKMTLKYQQAKKHIKEIDRMQRRIQECNELIEVSQQKYEDLKSKSEVELQSMNEDWQKQKDSHEKKKNLLTGRLHVANVKIQYLEKENDRVNNENKEIHENINKILNRKDSGDVTE